MSAFCSSFLSWHTPSSPQQETTKMSVWKIRGFLPTYDQKVFPCGSSTSQAAKCDVKRSAADQRRCPVRAGSMMGSICLCQVCLEFPTWKAQIFWRIWTRVLLEPYLKGSFTIFLFSVRTHILNSNGVWYSWFWSEGPKNAPNSRFWVFYFVPRDLDSTK